MFNTNDSQTAKKAVLTVKESVGGWVGCLQTLFYEEVSKSFGRAAEEERIPATKKSRDSCQKVR